MRIPFDLIAAILALEAFREWFGQWTGNVPRLWEVAWAEQSAPGGEVLAAILALALVAYLVSEGLVRRTEWRMRFGLYPQGWPGADGTPPRRHALQEHAVYSTLAQGLTVGLFILFLWRYCWPLRICGWPEWLGLDRWLAPQTCDLLGQGSFAGACLGIFPFALMLVASWLPRRRLLGALGRRPPLVTWLSFEARLTCLPVVPWFGLCLLLDIAVWIAPRRSAWAWLERPGVAILLGVGLLVLFAAVLLPGLVVWFWQCRPLPETELKQRLAALLARSGVRARAILSWGPQGSGLANACVLGPWSRLRYVLLSPALMRNLSPDECEAVVAHELGHVRYGHLVLLIALFMGMAVWSESLVRVLGVRNPLWQSAAYMAFFLAYIRLLFGAVSRRCEQEADLASAELLGTPFPLISALEKLGEMSGGIRDIYSWHHDSISARARRLLETSQDVQFMRVFHARQQRLRRWLILSAAVGVACLWGVTAWQAAHPEPDEPAFEQQAGEKGSATCN